MIDRLQTLYDPTTDPLYSFATTYADEYWFTCYTVWGLAIAFTIGDIITTWIAVTPLLGGPYDQFREAIPFTRWALTTFGPWILLPKKAFALGFIWVIWYLFPKPYQLLFPVLAMICNYLPTVFNLGLLIEYGIIQIPGPLF